MQSDIMGSVKRSKEHEDVTEISKEETIAIESVQPESHISLFGAVAFGMGSMIGSGIFVSPTGALAYSGSVGMSLVIWSLCGVLSLILGLIYAELGTLFPRSGGDFYYIHSGLGKLPAFLAVWIIQLFSHTAGMAVLALVFSNYLLALLFGSCTPPELFVKLTAAAMLLTQFITNAASAKIGVWIQIICTVAKVAALVVISVAGIVYLCQGSVNNFADAFDGSSTDISSYSLAMYSCIFAYGGFNRIGEIAEEIINPVKTIPKALFISIMSVTVIYVLTNISFFSILSKSDFLLSKAIAFDWAVRGIKPVAVLVPVSVLLSVYGANNGTSFGASRVIFSAARAGHLPEVMSYLHIRSKVPIVALIIVHIISLLMLIPGDVGKLINFLSFLSSVVVFLTSLTLLKVRYTRRNEERNENSFRAPLFVPVLGIVISVYIIITPFVSHPKIEFLYSLSLVVVGILLYIAFGYFEIKLPGMDRLSILLQLLCNVGPPLKVD